MKLDKHGQPLAAFNHKGNKIKALLALRGILQGVTADSKLGETELLFLDVWLKTDEKFKNDGDFLDLADILSDVLEDGVIEQDELDEIQEFLHDILDYGYQGDYTLDALTNQLLGFLQGITSDDYLNDTEILKLKKHLEDTPEVIYNWPGDRIHSRIEQILEDNVIDEDERADLLLMLKGICGQQFTDTGTAECSATDFFASNSLIESIKDKKVCFTGKFFAGSRKIMESLAKANGAEIKKNVTQDLDYLVIGSLAAETGSSQAMDEKLKL